MAFTSGQVVNAADLNDLDITTLTTSGTVTIGGFTLPAIDGSADQVLVTNGSGTVTWQDAAGGAPGGSDSQVQYNDGGVFGGSSSLTINDSTGVVTASTGILAGYLTKSITGAYTSIQAWASDPNWLAVQGGNGYLLLDGTYADDDIYLRSSNNSGLVKIGAGGSNTLEVGNGSATMNGTLTATGTVSADRLQVGGHYIDDVAGSGNPYGSINVGGAMTWDGYSIDNRVVFMHDGSDKWGIYDDTNNRWMIEGWQSGDIRLYCSGTERLRTANDYGINIYGPGGYTQIGSANSSWSHFITDRPNFYFNKGITVDTGYISSYNEDLELHRAGTKRLDITSTENYFTGDRTVHGRSTAGSAYYDSQLQSYSGYGSGGVASWTGHIGGQLAPVFRVWTGTGEGFDCNNYIGSAYRYVGGSSFVTRSSERIKRNIKDQADDEIIPTIMDLLSCRTIKFDDISIEPYWCEDDSCFKEPELCEDYDTCGCDRCAEIMNAPLQKRHFGRRGYLVEELAEVYPTAVHFESDGKPSGIDYSAVTVELIDAVKLLVLQGDEINRRLTALETS